MKKFFIILLFAACNKSSTQTLRQWYISRYNIDTILTDGSIITDSMILESIPKLELDSTVRIISE